PVAIAVPTEPAQAQRYDRNGNYVGPTWRGRDGRIYCRRSNGTTGLIVGGAAGALVGREIAGRGNRTVGTVVGAAAGALVGREVQRGRSARRCR
ncbi:MAG TPA: glycine zipper 2TM domain-containing protein, partial [Allosphingosinicella sp.]